MKNFPDITTSQGSKLLLINGDDDGSNADDDVDDIDDDVDGL